MSSDAFLMKSDLLERGWTEAAVGNFLGEPDDTSVNPHYRSGPRIKLFAKAKVEDAERSENFQEWLSKSHKRRQAAQKAAGERLFKA